MLENLFAHFDLGANGFYVWLAYGAAGIVMAALLILCVLVDSGRSDEYRALMQKISERPHARKRD